MLLLQLANFYAISSSNCHSMSLPNRLGGVCYIIKIELVAPLRFFQYIVTASHVNLLQQNHFPLCHTLSSSYVVPPSSCPESEDIDNSDEDIDKSELSAQFSQGLCRVLHSRDQDLVFSSHCYIETLKHLQTKDSCFSEDCWQDQRQSTLNVHQLVTSSAAKEIQDSVWTSLPKESDPSAQISELVFCTLTRSCFRMAAMRGGFRSILSNGSILKNAVLERVRLGNPVLRPVAPKSLAGNVAPAHTGSGVNIAVNEPAGGRTKPGEVKSERTESVLPAAAKSVENQKQGDESGNKTLAENTTRVFVKASVESELITSSEDKEIEDSVRNSLLKPSSLPQKLKETSCKSISTRQSSPRDCVIKASCQYFSFLGCKHSFSPLRNWKTLWITKKVGTVIPIICTAAFGLMGRHAATNSFKEIPQWGQEEEEDYFNNWQFYDPSAFADGDFSEIFDRPKTNRNAAVMLTVGFLPGMKVAAVTCHNQRRMLYSSMNS
ncbi:hypothetical protein POM88_026807 [Heracleum sosnowskyi]|uniref:Uncharacterized protein n=1 Tax=Heracleum sosnowskyi TaxID=360622 RepID=A0AAD8I792_9APIA|nr:hypothetical protein POM88_026807 [Heracleum sosnowskyi]